MFELALRLPDVVAMQTRQPSLEGTGEVRLRRLVKEALRMRPDRIVVGEVRQEECLDLLLALNSGVPGLATVHANSARDAVTKLCTLPLLAAENVTLAFVVPTVAAGGRTVVARERVHVDGTSTLRSEEAQCSGGWVDANRAGALGRARSIFRRSLMDSYDDPTSDAAILGRIRELVAGISDERTRAVLHNVSGALELNPQPIPPGILRIVVEAIALNPQPLPPAEDVASSSIEREEVALNPQPIPPGVLRTVLEAIALNPQPLPPAQDVASRSVEREEVALNPQPLPPDQDL